MATTLHHLPEYHTWRSPTENQANTTIDHVFHTPLPSNIALHEVGTIHSDVTNALSDHLPIWIGIALPDPFVLPSPMEKIPLAPRVDVDMHSDTEKLAYNEYLTTRLKTMPAATRNVKDDGSTVMSSFGSSRALGVILRHTELTVSAKTNGLNKEAKAKIARKCQRSRGTYKNRYSRALKQIKAYIAFYRNLLRTAFPGGARRRHTQWSAFSYTRLLQEWMCAWKTEYDQVLRQITPASPVSRFPSPTHLADKPYASITRAYLNAKIKSWEDCTELAAK
jgi:hypothetical protein